MVKKSLNLEKSKKISKKGKKKNVRNSKIGKSLKNSQKRIFFAKRKCYPLSCPI